MPKTPESVIGLRDPTTRVEHSAGTLEAQLVDLYAQRRELEDALGTSDSKAIIAMIRSLEEQLEDLYRLFEGRNDHLPHPRSALRR